MSALELRSAVGTAIMSVALATGSAAPTESAQKVFVTSTTHSGNLGGLAGADAICQTRAAAAALSGTFRAWLSTSTADAYCRIAGGSGPTKASNCGQGTLPDGGPYERVDGVAFAPGLQGLTGSGAQIWSMLSVDENGAAVTSPFVFTGTDAAGVFTGSSCSDWSSSASVSAAVGDPLAGPSRWTYSGIEACADLHRLACFELGTSPPVSFVEENGALIFVSSTGFTPGGGIAAADALCAARASAAFLPSSLSFHAWLATSTASAASRFTWNGAYKRVDGRGVATSLADFSDAATVAADPELSNGPWKSELDLGRSTAVYTGSPFGGGASTLSATCDDWTSSGAEATVGLSSSTRGTWSEYASLPCDNALAVYCLSDQPVLFWDHFESGGLARWTAVP